MAAEYDDGLMCAGNPATMETEIEGKFRELTSGVLTPRRADAIILTVRGLERLKNMSELTFLLVSDRKQKTKAKHR